MIAKVGPFKTKTAKKNYLESLIGSEKATPIPYDMSSTLEVGQFIEHPKFGLGFIQAIINERKVDVFFESYEKVLMQNYTVG